MDAIDRIFVDAAVDSIKKSKFLPGRKSGVSCRYRCKLAIRFSLGVFQILIKGGWMMIPLAICSLVAVTIIVDRFMFFRRTGVPHRGEEVITAVSQGKIEAALSIIDEAPGAILLPIIRVLSAGITYPSDPEGAMEATGVGEISLMRRGLVALDTIITASPLLGLLGTIIGMIDSVKVMASAGLGQPHAVTGGVAEALIATATGITIAVIALIPYNYFLSRIEIIPMIDTMFFLLVFFMVATLSMTMQKGLQVNLPHAATAREDVYQTVTFTLTKEGKLYFNKDEAASVADAVGRLKGLWQNNIPPSVIINGDRSVEHGKVIELMDAVGKEGIIKMAVAVKPNR
jgi:biopolymer transport protein ExbB